MESVEQIIRKYIDQTPEERLESAKKATKEIAIYLNANGFNDKEALNFYLNIIRLFVSADECCGEDEYLLFKKILNVEISYDTFHELTNGGATETFVEAMDDVIDLMPYEIKLMVCVLGLTIICSDGIVNEKERELFKKVLD